MDHTSAAEELGQLLDVLLAAHEELSEGLMPRAARITGTGQQLMRVISRVEMAIHKPRTCVPTGNVAPLRDARSVEMEIYRHRTSSHVSITFQKAVNMLHPEVPDEAKREPSLYAAWRYDHQSEIEAAIFKQEGISVAGILAIFRNEWLRSQRMDNVSARRPPFLRRIV